MVWKLVCRQVLVGSLPGSTVGQFAIEIVKATVSNDEFPFSLAYDLDRDRGSKNVRGCVTRDGGGPDRWIGC